MHIINKQWKENNISFDIQKQDFSKSAELGYEFELKLPTGEGAGAFLTVIGDLSPTVKQYSRRKYQEFTQRQAIARRKGKEEELSLEDAEELAIEAALVRLINWRGFTEDGKEVKFSKEKAREVLAQHAWIRDQIVEEASDVGNYKPKM